METQYKLKIKHILVTKIAKSVEYEEGGLEEVYTFGEVESECGLIRSKIVNVEDKLIGQVLLVPPHDPPDTGVHQPVLVATHIYTLDQGQPEVPLEFRVQKRGDESATRGIHVNRRVPTAL